MKTETLDSGFYQNETLPFLCLIPGCIEAVKLIDIYWTNMYI